MVHRLDKISGIVIGCVGALQIVSTTGALLVSAMQRAIVAAGRFPPGFEAMQELQLTFAPWSLVNGIVYIAAGIGMYRGALMARRVAQGMTIAGYVAIIAMSLACYSAAEAMMPMFKEIPESFRAIYPVMAVASNLVLGCAIQTALLVMLCWPRGQRTGSSSASRAMNSPP